MMSLTKIPQIEPRIRTIRGVRVMIDTDLAELYGVTTSNLNLAVRRNIDRFPGDFMFQLTGQEFKNLKLQFAISSSHGGRRTAPFVFTEQGVAMLSSVLRSERAVMVNIEIVRAFVRMRQMIGTHDDLARKIADLEKRVKSQGGDIKVIFAAINTMLNPVTTKKPQIGFQRGKTKKP